MLCQLSPGIRALRRYISATYIKRVFRTCTTSTTRDLQTMSSENGLILYTAGTPNGHKTSVLLEELKAKYGLQYECVHLPHLPIRN